MVRKFHVLRYAFVLSAFVVSFAMGAATRTYVDHAKFGRYAEANRALLQSEDTVQINAVFMGNSITDFWPTKRPAFFADNGFVGRGISGQTSFEMLNRFRRDVVDLHPKAVVICAGTNDIAQNLYNWYDEDVTFGNIASMAEIARANGIEVYLASVPPATSFKWNPSIKDIDRKIVSLNRLIKGYCDINGCIYVDYYTPLVVEGGKMNPKYSADGVHPNAAGYAVMESVIAPLLK